MHKNFIAGEWLEGADATENVNPSDTRDVVGLYVRAGRGQAEQAIAAAHAAAPRWAALTPLERSEALDKVGSEIGARKEQLAMLLAREEGKALADARARSSAPRRSSSSSPGRLCGCRANSWPARDPT